MYYTKLSRNLDLLFFFRYLNQIKESNETNNSLTKSFTVTNTRTFDINADYDGDGLTNGQEQELGTDPLSYDENNPTVTRTTQTNDQKVSITATGDTNIKAAPFQVIEAQGSALNSLSGLVGKPIEISMGGYALDSADITINYDVNQLNGASEDDLQLYAWS